MIVLISDILKLSELESTAEDAGKARVALLGVAAKAAESLSVQAAEKNVKVTVSGEDGILNANPDRMMQLTLNLIDNAVKYNRPGGSVFVTVAQQTDSVTLTVADTGVGIPPEAQGRIFERFYRVDKSRSRRMGGTGLGLSIVKHIVELYHGKIGLKSEVGRGTEITVTLPTESPC
jgi:two-component system phosphate regulon sensor histidine kinase PhoR